MRYSRCEMLKNTGKLRIFNVFHTCALYFKIFFGNNFSTASLIYYDTMASLLFFFGNNFNNIDYIHQKVLGFRLSIQQHH